jgi:hypothetical protein
MIKIGPLGFNGDRPEQEFVELTPDIIGEYKLSRVWQGLNFGVFFIEAVTEKVRKLTPEIDYDIVGDKLIIKPAAVQSGKVTAGKILLFEGIEAILEFPDLKDGITMYYFVQNEEEPVYNVKIKPVISDKLKDYIDAVITYFENEEEKETKEYIIPELSEMKIFGVKVFKIQNIMPVGSYIGVTLDIEYEHL